MPIIRSMMDTDLYKLTMQQAVLERYPGVPVVSQFMDRKPTGLMDDDFLKELRDEIDSMAELRLTAGEAEFLSGLEYLKPQYIDWLDNYRFDPRQVKVSLDNGDTFQGRRRLQMPIKGDWEDTILWEVPLLAIVSELYFKRYPLDGYNPDENNQFDLDKYSTREECAKSLKSSKPLSSEDSLLANALRLHEKGMILSGLKFSDFGTRRRRRFLSQHQAVDILKTYPGFQGTSNVHLAQLYKVKPIGTCAHEWTMGASVLEGLRHANRHALRAWSKVYKGQLGIALTDTFGTEAFWGDFDSELARLYDGVRHDSNDPAPFTVRTILHYKKLGIDSRKKEIVYSDSLTARKCRDLADQFDKKIGQSFGIGTHFSNDVPGSPALNIVIKMRECNGVPVVKLSDEPGKATGDRDARRVAEWVFFKRPLDKD